MSQTWSVIAYYYTGGVEIYGPYSSADQAAQVSEQAKRSTLFENAIRLSMTPWEGAE